MSKLGAGTADLLPNNDQGDLSDAKAPQADASSDGYSKERSSNSGYIKPQQRKLHDSAVTFEEYHYYALRTRAEEQQAAQNSPPDGIKSIIFPSKSAKGAEAQNQAGNEAAKNLNLSDRAVRATISDEEWTNASRALRTASWGAAFYLITTDILGPFGLPFAFSTMGWGPGIALYTVFAALAGYSGYLLWDIFMGMDSYEFPIKSFGDLGFRLLGRWCRYLFNFLQGIQLILNVGLIVISNGEALSQAAKFKLCFSICCLIWVIVGFFLGQVRTLQKFGWLANVAVWLNLICMFITMGAAAHSLPNYNAVGQSAGATFNGGVSVTPNGKGVFPPVQTTAGLPDPGSFIGSVSGAMQAIFAYGGSMIFPEFMAEMRRPHDFLKGMWTAQAFIYVCYMLYGLFMYAYQGQYTVNPSYLGIGPYNLQTAGNVFAIVSAVIAAALYGNIGVKVIYNSIFVEIFRAPQLTTRRGKIAWMGMIPIYWAIAFVIAAGIPNFSGLTSVVAAFCILQFTYTFPPLLSVVYLIKKNSMRGGDGFDIATGKVTRSATGWSRYMRGFWSGRWYQNVFNVLYTMGSLALAGLGAYSAIEVLKAAFAQSRTNSFVCKSPLQPS